MEMTDFQIVKNVEPQLIQSVGRAVWNNEEISKYLEEKLAKYNNLVVTQDNLKEMKGVLREIVSVRTHLQRFGTEQKRLLKEPYNVFAAELEQVLAVVSRVEAPISNQIQEFENIETEKRKELVMNMIRDKFEVLGIREEYRNRFVADPKWWQNKTAKIDATASAIDSAMNDLLAQQNNDDEIAKMRAEKEEMVKLKIDIFNSQYELNTPITFDDVAHKVMNVSISELDGYLADEFDKRLEIEMQAAKAHTIDVDKSEPVVVELPLPQQPMKFEEVEETIRTTYVVKLTESQRKIVEDTLNKIGVEWSRI